MVGGKVRTFVKNANMARINVGVPPKYLSDQHLIAESVEITMIVGALRRDGWKIKGEVPKRFTLGKGHINFFKPKLKYLEKRLESVNNEMRNRGFKPTTFINAPDSLSKPLLWGDWTSTSIDSKVVRERITERLTTPLKAKAGFHKYYGKSIDDMKAFSTKLLFSELGI